MTDQFEAQYQEFLADQEPAVDQLRVFLGGEVGKALDGSLRSLETVDTFVNRLTSNPKWYTAPMYELVSDNVQAWLAVRLAYYLGDVLKRAYGATWDRVRDPMSPLNGTPVMNVAGVQLSPLEIAAEYIRGHVEGGLVGLLRDLDAELSCRRQ